MSINNGYLAILRDAAARVRSSFEPPPVEGIFSLGVNMGSDSTTTNSFESINQGLVCAHMHSITQNQKIRTFMF